MLKPLLFTVFAAALMSAAAAPAYCQIEDGGYILTQLAQATGCSPCYQSCVMTQAVIQFDYNIPALMSWLYAITQEIDTNLVVQIIEDDAWFFGDWPLIDNKPRSPVMAKPSLPVMLPLLPGVKPSGGYVGKMLSRSTIPLPASYVASGRLDQ